VAGQAAWPVGLTSSAQLGRAARRGQARLRGGSFNPAAQSISAIHDEHTAKPTAPPAIGKRVTPGAYNAPPKAVANHRGPLHPQ